MHLIGDMTGAQHVDFLRAAGAAADVHSAHCALLAKDRRTSRNRFEIRDMPDANSENIGKSFHGWVSGSMVASESGDRTYLLDLLKEPVLAAQEFFLLAGRALKNIFRRPHYGDDIALQMDAIGVGSLPIVVMIGSFSGAVMALQMSRALSQYGQVGKTGTLVSLTLVRELGPVLTAIMVAGRNSTGMASELGSMKVTEQIDAMRALGTDPVQKLVTPRVIATCVMLPLLTIIADFVGMVGGFIIAKFLLNIESRQYWTSVWRALEWNDVTQGLLKPLVFALIVSLMGCYQGLKTTGGTQGVGRSTTQAMVLATILIFVLDLLITDIFVSQGGA
jgi:phospholipid/cholesterol/gamma-HCH transport system permease protein